MATQTPQPLHQSSLLALPGDEPELTLRPCSICGGDGRSVARAGQTCNGCGGAGWLAPYDPDSVVIPF